MRTRSLTVLSAVLIVVITLVAGSATAAPGVDDDVDCADETEVDTVVSADEVVKTETVSTAWYQNTEYVREIREDFEAAYPVDETEWLNGIGITAIDEPVCERNQMAISLWVADEERADHELGDTYEEVPLVIEERGEDIIHPVAEVNDVYVSMEGVYDASEADADDSPQADADDSPENDAEDGDNTADENALPGFGVVPTIVGLTIAVLVARTGVSR